MLRLLPFVVATLTPAGLLLAACVFGGPWAGSAILAITVVVFGLDKIGRAAPLSKANGHRLSATLGVLHFVLLGAAAWAMNGPQPLLDKVLLVIGCGLYFGQISNSNAHELIHRSNRWAFRLGAANYASLLFGHHTSAHRLVHHVHAATPNDPATARRGEGFWAYLPRTWAGSFFAGLRAERQRSAGTRWPAPYVGYVGGAFITLGIAYTLGDVAGMAGVIAIALYAQTQLMLSDYVQHYGLERRVQANGRREQMGPQHSWNAPHWYSSAMMLNAPRHSAHHTKPGQAFPQLELDSNTMPMLPHSLPVMAVIALVPPLWRRVMDRRVAAWRGHPSAQNSAMTPATL
ncbi:MAG: alkane 1-monooxygenase [Pseudomonadota bacterium]